jgi:hypothetical protein
MWCLKSEMKIKNRSNADLEIVVTGITYNPDRRIILGSRQPFMKNATKSYPFHKMDKIEVQIYRTGFKDRIETFLKCGTWKITDESMFPIESIIF